MKSKAIRYLAGIAILLPMLFHVAGLTDFRALRELEYKLYDARLRLTAPMGIDPRIVIIDIDEKSLSAEGQWPWNRDVLARLITTLFEQYNIEVLGLDMVFAEPDEDVTLNELRSTFSVDELEANPTLKQILNKPTRDQIFADTLQRYNVVMGYIFGTEEEQANIGSLPFPLFDKDSGLSEKSFAPKNTRFSGNLDILQQRKAGGFFSLYNALDSDGSIRKIPLLNEFEGALYPTLGLSVANEYLGTEIEPVIVEVNKDGGYAALEGLNFGPFTVTMDQNSAVHVPYRAHKKAFEYVSATDVLTDNVAESEKLEGVIALLGTSAPGLVDNRSTPIHQLFPGVEVHANLIAGLLDGHFRSYPGWAKGAEVIVTLLVGLILVFLLPSLRAVSMTIVSAIIILGYIAVNFMWWQRNDFIVALAPILVTAFLIYLVNLIFGYFLETRMRMQMKQSFGLYVPPEIVDSMQGKSVQTLLRSEKKPMTVLFTDVRGFTALSERLSPEALSELMNRFLTPMTEIVHRNGGAIDKYMGDAMMAFWGAPLENAKHAEAATLAAIEMQFAMIQLNEDFAADGLPRIEIGIGVNTGPMSVGNMGSEFRMAYTVLGDAVNLGSRLEGLTKQYGVPILLGETTAAACAHLVLSEVDQVRVKGKEEPIKIFTPVGKEGEVSIKRMHHRDQFARALACYRLQNWTGALDLLNELYDDQRKALYNMYINRVNHFMRTPPPPDWDGVFDFKVK
ncbi:MAG: adenylate/guanylate cyclase domain-containing protein [Acidiferrobacterales bacterium]|nr:adenylate/guanylate cyclase domain-containing protein [Acidiferrobacterales bacterium]